MDAWEKRGRVERTCGGHEMDAGRSAVAWSIAGYILKARLGSVMMSIVGASQL